MGIQVEFNPDLALRNIKECREGRRTLEECIPESLLAEHTYPFLKQGQRNYWFDGEIPLLETNGKILSRPLASIIIREATHFKKRNIVYTHGLYLVKAVFDRNDPTIHYEGLARL